MKADFLTVGSARFPEVDRERGAGQKPSETSW